MTEKEKIKYLTVKAIRATCEEQGLRMTEQQAYVVATVEHETAGTFAPVREAFWLDEKWRRENLRYFPYYGRGYVQLTWMSNYEKYSKILKVDMVAHPDIALEPNSARFILVHGFKNGTFTGHNLERFINSNLVDYRSARRVINGLDKADHIKDLAKKWYREFSMSQESMYIIQKRLNELDADPAVDCDGIYGPKTEKALKSLQKAYQDEGEDVGLYGEVPNDALLEKMGIRVLVKLKQV